MYGRGGGSCAVYTNNMLAYLRRGSILPQNPSGLFEFARSPAAVKHPPRDSGDIPSILRMF
ncbi:MAG TPA: hypothetical protein DDZ99_00045 [Clostridiales bacterium]|nr:hypothetical protein [Clostridiales bacterium]